MILNQKEQQVLNEIKNNLNSKHIIINNNHTILANKVGISINDLNLILDSLVKGKVLSKSNEVISKNNGKKDYKGRGMLENSLAVDVYKVI